MKCDITINVLAKRFELARSTLLYYDRVGLLHPSARSGGNYRLYSQCDIERLKQICLYRKMGIPLREISRLLGRRKNGKTTPSREILKRRLTSLENEIESLQLQQLQIVRLLEQLAVKKSAGVGGKKFPKSRARTNGKKLSETFEMENQMISKKRWTEIMQASGMTDEDMKNWHMQFEKMEPDAHQEFLESLGIDADEIARIREWSQG